MIERGAAGQLVEKSAMLPNIQAGSMGMAAAWEGEH